MINSIGNSLKHFSTIATDRLQSIRQTGLQVLTSNQIDVKTTPRKVAAVALLIFAAFITYKLCSSAYSAIKNCWKGKSNGDQGSKAAMNQQRLIVSPFPPEGVTTMPQIGAASAST